MEGAEVSSTEVSLAGLRAYKVFGDGHTAESMRHCAWEMDDLDGRDSIQHPEWKALYQQFKALHVLGTVPYRWESKTCAYTHAQLVEVHFDSLDVILLDGPLLHDGRVGAHEKAGAVKTHLGLGKMPVLEASADAERSGLLMHEIGRLGKAALVRETEDEWELLVPHCLLPRLRFSETIIARWRRHRTLPISTHWLNASLTQETGVDCWEAWDDSLEPPCIPDLEMPWAAMPDESRGMGCGACD